MFADLLASVLKTHPTVLALHNSFHYAQFKIAIVEKKPNLYVTDGDTCFQALFKHNFQDTYPNPFNNVYTDYYTYIRRIAFCFDFKEEHVSKNATYLNPYEPRFHLSSDF